MTVGKITVGKMTEDGSDYGSVAIPPIMSLALSAIIALDFIIQHLSGSSGNCDLSTIQRLVHLHLPSTKLQHPMEVQLLHDEECCLFNTRKASGILQKQLM